MNGPQDEQTFEERTAEGLRISADYWLPIRKRIWLIAIIVLSAVVVTFVKSSQMKPVYRATSKVLIERYNPQVIKVEEVMPDDVWASDYYPTQYEILKSASLAERVVRSNLLHQHSEFNPEPEKGWLPFNVRSTLASVVLKVRAAIPQEEPVSGESDHKVPDDPLARYVGAYLGRLQINPVRNSRLVNISFEGYDPVLITEIANAHAQAYIDKTMDMKVSASQEAVGWLGGRLDELKQALQESKERLQQFVEREDIVTLENILSASGGREENILTQKLGQLNSGLSAARTESIGLATRHQQITEASRNADLLQSVPDVVNNPIVQSVKRELIALKREYLERLEKYGEKHPRMNALRKEIASVQSRLEVEVARVAKSVKMQYEMALANEKSLEEALEKAKSEVMELNKKAIHYGMVKQEVESNREMYEMIMKRAKETSLTSALKSTNVHIVDRAKVPRSPVRPQVRKNTLMAAAIALMLGAGLALLLEYMDHTFHGPDEVRRYLGVPYLGSVGLAPRIKRAKASELIALEDPRANAVETVRTVRTNVLFSFTNAGPKALVITSPGPLEGKTFITANLALTLAQMGRRVLLVDGDLRKPRLHKIFGKRSKPGLSDLISGNCTLCEAAKDTQVKDLKFLPSGKAPPNPSEILGCNRMQDFVAQCMASFDFVLFDTPPVLSVTDASALAGSIDGTVVVLKAGETKRGNARRALEQLKAIDSNVLGVVLNQVDFKKNRYYYNYDTSYYYGHYGHYGGNGRKRGQRSREVDRTSDDISDADYSPPAQLEI